MNWFLQTDAYTYYGWGVLKDLFHGRRECFFGDFITNVDRGVRTFSIFDQFL